MNTVRLSDWFAGDNVEEAKSGKLRRGQSLPVLVCSWVDGAWVCDRHHCHFALIAQSSLGSVLRILTHSHHPLYTKQLYSQHEVAVAHLLEGISLCRLQLWRSHILPRHCHETKWAVVVDKAVGKESLGLSTEVPE